MASWVVGIYAWSTVWNIFDLTQPQRPLTEKMPYLSEKWGFDDPFHKELPVMVFLETVMIRPSGSWSFLSKLGFRGCWGQWGCQATDINEAGEVSKAWKITAESSRFLNSIIWGLISLSSEFLKKKILTESWKLMLNFSTFSAGGCWGHVRSKKFQMVDQA